VVSALSPLLHDSVVRRNRLEHRSCTVLVVHFIKDAMLALRRAEVPT
jgi:hypothetical protein